MAEKVGGIEYEVDIDLHGLVKGAKKTERELSRLEKKTKSTDRAFSNLSKVAIGVFSGLAVRKLTAYSDAFTNLQNQIRQVTKDTENLNTVTQALFGVANDTRSSIDATANLYSKLARSTQGLGLSQQDVIDLTKTINQSFATSGASAQEASNAITQLGQGLSAGALRGDEFNSVAEQAPGILRAVSAETGLTIGQLRSFAAEGKITTELLVRSLKNYGTTAQREFDKSKMSVEQANQVLDNTFTQFIGTLDETVNGSELAANAIIGLSNRLIELRNYIGTGALVDIMQSQWSFIADDVKNATQFVEDEFTDLIDFFIKEAPKTSQSMIDGFKNFVPNVKAVIKLATVELAAFVDKAGAIGKAIAQSINPFDDMSGGEARKELTKQFELSDQARLSSIEKILKERDEDVKTTDAVIKNSEARIIQFTRESEEKQKALGLIKNVDFGSAESGEDGGKDPVQNAVTMMQAFKDELIKTTDEAKNLDTALGSAFGQNSVAAVDNLSNSLADALINQESLGDAVRDTARAFLRDMIASLIKTGAQMAINYALGETFKAASTATTVASMGTIAAASAPAAAGVSIATGGGAAVTGSAAATAAIAAITGAIASSGNRFNGGNIQAGGLYRVNELNKSEGVMFGHGNSQYLMPNKNGKVISNKDMAGGGGGKLNVIVNNYGEPAETRVTQTGNNVTIDMIPNLVTQTVSSDFANNGRMMKSLKSNTNVINKAR